MCVQSVADDTATTLSEPPAGVRERERDGGEEGRGGIAPRICCMFMGKRN